MSGLPSPEARLQMMRDTLELQIKEARELETKIVHQRMAIGRAAAKLQPSAEPGVVHQAISQMADRREQFLRDAMVKLGMTAKELCDAHTLVCDPPTPVMVYDKDRCSAHFEQTLTLVPRSTASATHTLTIDTALMRLRR
jgi:hypothetical protein